MGVDEEKTIELSRFMHKLEKSIGIRKCALKSACHVYGELKGRQEKYNWDDIASDIMFLADKFYDYILEQEECEENRFEEKEKEGEQK